MTDTIADMLTRIRNAQQRRLVSVAIPYSNFKSKILDVMQAEGYIGAYEKKDLKNNIANLEVSLKYSNGGVPVIQEIHRVSKCGCRVYSNIDDLPGFYNNLGTIILSTSKGVMSDRQARQEGVGGEVICKMF